MACGGGDGTECGPGTTAADGVCLPDGSDLECGEGTFEHNGQCVAYDPNDSGAPAVTAMPPGGPTRALPLFVALTTDEPATIYYTTDGSEPTTSSAHDTSPTIVTGIEDGTEIRYFAVDPTGNAAAVASAVYDLDVTGPAAVSALTSVAEPGQITVSWENPSDADFAGALLVRSAGHVPTRPEDGTLYEVGDELAPGEAIVVAGEGASFTDDDTAVPGAYFYAAWTYDGLGNYSPVRLSRVLRPLPAQQGSLSVDLATGTVTATTPANLGLSATATYDDAGDTLALNVTVRNDTRRLLFNLKSRVAPNEGTAEGPLFAGAPYVYFGPEALDVGASVTREVVITGVTGAQDPLIVDLDFANHPMLVTGRHEIGFTDTAGTDQGYSRGADRVRQGAVSVDGRFVYAGNKHLPRITIADTREVPEEDEEVDFAPPGARPSAAVPLTTGSHIGSIGGLDVSLKHGAVYAGVNEGVHWHGGDSLENRGAPSRTDLVWLHAGTLEEMGRVILRQDDPDSRTIRSVLVSPDESRAAVLLTSSQSSINELWLVDLDSFSVIDSDPDTAGDQPIPLSSTGWAEQGVWGEDGASFYVAFNTHRFGEDGEAEADAGVDAVDLGTGTVTRMQPLGGGRGSGRLAVHDGKLFVPTRAGEDPKLTIFDLATGATTEVVHGLGESTGVLLHPSADLAYVVTRGLVAVYDATTGARVDLDGDAANGITNIDPYGSPGPHFMALTPF